ncbi:hypothetical protein N7468_008873 [Penicillium chermesinum]|uniref:Uncharacterized protein n=1 Tax=Penicillium chermesinum TaxID=63820 RepID=A0A9W9NJB0_9EURO|nr:uncharacterized protein N7468_008873 [Penicillium chermesinum]KAJ5219669.1 hypothetical protein N7468_008873 [Penicillium chermesinum]
MRAARNTQYALIIWDVVREVIGHEFPFENEVYKVERLIWSEDGACVAAVLRHTDQERYWKVATSQGLFKASMDERTSEIDTSPTEIRRKNFFVFLNAPTFDAVGCIDPDTTFQIAIPPEKYQLGDRQSWIYFNGKRLLWLPPAYRPRLDSGIAFHETQTTVRVAIACLSGQTLTMEFAKDCHRI